VTVDRLSIDGQPPHHIDDT